ncbi:MAG: reprolysin-like metallopeptidase [Tahibacter sp.]
MGTFLSRGIALAAILAASGATSNALAVDSGTLWADSAKHVLESRVPHPGAFRALSLQLPAMRAYLDGEARRGEIVALPRPDGGFSEFVLSDSGTMPPELAAKFPEIRSFVGVDRDGNQARIDVSPLGFNAMVFDRGGIWMVQPQAIGDGSDYMSFERLEAGSSDKPFICGVHGKPDAAQTHLPRTVEPMITTGTTKRTYRAAVAANHNYVIAVSPVGGATVATGLAAVVMAVNRVNQVYENDFSIHLTLIANNNLIIYPAAVGDPYPNDDSAIDVNTGNLNTVIGGVNYDIGHVFTTGSGGVAGLGVVCDAAQKGDGTTGLTNPTGDTFYIDYVAHEMGHQFGGDHTFNGTGSNCGGGNRNGPTAYEPGSGSTIMAYAGICGSSNNLQAHSDPYFHASSLNEIKTFTSDLAGGASCGTAVANANAVPTIAALSNFIIPARTPFVLTGSATSTSGGTLTYDWEQFDLGAANNTLATDPGNGPIMRSFNPGGTSRTVPRLADLIAGTSTIGNILPTTNRTMNFRLTVRDNVSLAGTSNSADMTVQSFVTTGAFAVTAPSTATTWTAGGVQTVTWNVSGTTAAPISCSQISLELSQDGGTTYPLALGTFPNNGTASVTVPNITTTQARVRASCVGNIFFNISAPNFTVAPDLIFANGFQ